MVAVAATAAVFDSASAECLLRMCLLAIWPHWYSHSRSLVFHAHSTFKRHPNTQHTYLICQEERAPHSHSPIVPFPNLVGKIEKNQTKNQKTNKNNIHTYYISFIINIYNTEYRIRISREYAEMHLILILLCYYILCMRKAYIVCASMNWTECIILYNII